MLLLGSGELGKEVAIELQRFAVEVIAVDRYADAPAMQVAHRSHVIDMLDGDGAARADRAREARPRRAGDRGDRTRRRWSSSSAAGLARDIPTARAAWLTMDREGIRRLAAEELGLPTSPYRFVDTHEEYRAAIAALGLPCVIKPVMSVSGKGQSMVRSEADIDAAWDYAQSGGRAGAGPRDRRGVRRFRLRDHAADRAPRRRHARSARRSAIASATATIAKAGSRSR